jgi:hypothetical protein
VKPFYTTVWRVTKACGCPILRTKDKYDAVTLAADGHHILDAVACHSPSAEARELGGATGCGCGQ